MKKRVLIMTGYYIPGVKGGGPIQSIKNVVDNLSKKIDFYIITADRDLGDTKPFDNIIHEKWVNVGDAKVYYINPSNLTWNKTIDVINSIDYDVMYLNSFFNYKFSIVPVLLKKLNKIKNKNIILAPRGEFSPGALRLKYLKKKIYINLVKIAELYNGITWHATAETEKTDIESIFGDQIEIKIVNNLTANYKKLNYDKSLEKKKGELKIVFISRVHPKKNLIKAIQFLKGIVGDVHFNIYGPKEDKAYWAKCVKLIAQLPQNIKVSYKGIVEHDKIMEIFKSHHVFLFPTLGENYGHVISEALIGGCPVIVSDRTPWRDLVKHNAGWDISLDDEKQFSNKIQYCVDLNQEMYNHLSKCAFDYGKQMANQDKDINKLYNMLYNFN